MEIVDVLFTVTALGLGGTERYVADLAAALARLGVRVAVAVDSGPMHAKPSLEAAGIPIHSLGVEDHCSRKEYSARIGAVLSRYSVRLIHANMWLRENWLREIARLRNIPLVATGHYTVSRPRMNDWLGLNKKPFALYRHRRTLSKGNAGTICISEMSLTNHRYAYGLRARAIRVYCGRPDNSARADASAGGTSPQIVWLGQMIARKRPFLAIEAFRSLISRYPDCTLIMAGDGELSSRVRQEATSLGGRVKIVGHVSDVHEYLGSSDMLLHTAANEGTPLAIVEAMSAGIPVVATNAGATAELVLNGVTGLLVPVDSHAGVAGALVTLASNPELRSQYGKAARRVFDERFSYSRMVAETIAAYERLVGVAVSSQQDRRSLIDKALNSSAVAK
jgi:glycosyltransferase involved in cell wall biosynthesis